LDETLKKKKEKGKERRIQIETTSRRNVLFSTRTNLPVKPREKKKERRRKKKPEG